MKKIIILFFTIATLPNMFGQNVRILNMFQQTEKHKVKTFDLIDPSFNLEGKTKIAIFEGHSLDTGKETLASLFNDFWFGANRLGGNSFTLDKISDINNRTFIVITVYYLSKDDLKRNFELYPKNMVYVIGNIDKKKKEKKITFNDQNISVEPMKYIAFQNEVGEVVKLNVGSLLGASMRIKGKENRLPTYLSTKGFGVESDNLYNTNASLSVSFNTGRIIPIELNLGQFLVRILEEQEI